MRPRLKLEQGEYARKLSTMAAVKPGDFSKDMNQALRELDAVVVARVLEQAFGGPSFEIRSAQSAQAWLLRDKAGGEIIYVECWPESGPGVYLFSNKANGVMPKLLVWLQRKHKARHLRIV